MVKKKNFQRNGLFFNFNDNKKTSCWLVYKSFVFSIFQAIGKPAKPSLVKE